MIETGQHDQTPAGAATPVPSPGQPPLAHELFAAQAARQPDATAILAGHSRVTYRQLDESSSRLAHYLRAAGLGPGTVTGVHLDRGTDLVRSLLAIMKAGGGYLPLDTALPGERLARICAQVSPAAVLTAGTDTFPAAGAGPGGPRVLALAGIRPALTGQPAHAPASRPRPDSLCYVIHTSGTTGDPKAVAVGFGSLGQVIGDLVGQYQVTPRDRVAQVAATAFDTSLEQVLVTLAGGATLVLPPPRTLAPAELLRGIERRQVTVLDLTPAYWHQLAALTGPSDERLRSVRLMITGGEPADPADCRALLRAAPRARLLNAYGLTETTITTTLFDVGPWLAGADHPAAVPVGRPVAGARIMVLDPDLRPVAAGTPGEVYIGGDVVAQGYLGQPGLTAERFRPDPERPPGGRMYRTGDTGQLLEDGSLVVGGRTDRQLKVRGYRVDPGEIESVLAGHPGVAEVSVTAVTRGAGDTRLVARYTPAPAAPGTRPPSAASLRRYLADRLPGYMIPSSFTARGTVPAQKTRPAPAAAPGGRPTPAGAVIAALWSRLLSRDQVGPDDDFFALGGNSLLAAEMLAHARALLGIPADAVQELTRRLLRDPSLRSFADAAERAAAGTLDAERDPAGIDFAAETRLAAGFRPAAGSPRPGWRQPREVLLTGATGFLGAHLLHELVTETGARVHCLVRAADETAALTRIRQAAARYELPPPPPGRVTALAGDLGAPRLGLPAPVFRDLGRRLDVIYHPAAQVNFIYPYQELRAVNVDGTREVLRLAADSRGIPVHYVSTTAVLAGLGAAGIREADEETPLAHPELLRMGYVETKYVAEELVRAAAASGLPAAVYRPLDITGRRDGSAWPTVTEMCALIRFMADTGLAPDIDLPLDFVPVDVCAAAIRHISVSAAARGQTYHLASPRSAPLSDLAARLRARGYPVEAVPYGDWVQALARHAAQDPAHPMAAFLPLFVNRGPSGLTVAELYFRDVFPAYSRERTAAALRGSGIAFPPVSAALVDRNLDWLARTGFLPAPGSGGRAAGVSARVR